MNKIKPQDTHIEVLPIGQVLKQLWFVWVLTPSKAAQILAKSNVPRTKAGFNMGNPDVRDQVEEILRNYRARPPQKDMATQLGWIENYKQQLKEKRESNYAVVRNRYFGKE